MFTFSKISILGILLAIQGRKDYLMLQMVEGTMTFTVDNGRGPIMAVFKPDSKFKFCDGNWHEIHAVKAKNVVTLSVDDIFAQPGIGVPGVSSTDTNHGLFIGGQKFFSEFSQQSRKCINRNESPKETDNKFIEYSHQTTIFH